MSSLNELKSERLKKLEILKQKGIDPYPMSTERNIEIAEALGRFEELEKSGEEKIIAGRIMAVRGHGGLMFFDVNDGSEKIQAHMKKDEVGEELFALFGETIDIGDFVEVRGKFFTTKRGEKSIDVKSWKILAKSLLPLPEKWHGLQDVEEKSRKRYLDLLMDEESKKRFVLRSKIISEIRSILEKAGYLEVETPILQALAGGATAAPFKTHHNALDIDLNLRIAPELYLKKLLVGGFPKVYELGRCFRNEGVDATHNPEFTMLEFYEAYSDAKKQRAFVEAMLQMVVKNVLDKNEIEWGGEKIDFSKPFSVVPYLDLLKENAGVDYENSSRDDLAKAAAKVGIKVENFEAKEKIADNIYKKVCRSKIIQPTFLIDYPIEFSPFAKQKEGNPKLIDRFQFVVGGMEFVNAFSELNDPLEQRKRFEEQDIKKRAGEGDVSPSDEEYLEAMEHGMPPAGGVGIGIDRLVMLLTDTQNIRDVILFPLLRPKEWNQ